MAMGAGGLSAPLLAFGQFTPPEYLKSKDEAWSC
jgi:hypothetical protein